MQSDFDVAHTQESRKINVQTWSEVLTDRGNF